MHLHISFICVILWLIRFTLDNIFFHTVHFIMRKSICWALLCKMKNSASFPCSGSCFCGYNTCDVSFWSLCYLTALCWFGSFWKVIDNSTLWPISLFLRDFHSEYAAQCINRNKKCFHFAIPSNYLHHERQVVFLPSLVLLSAVEVLQARFRICFISSVLWVRHSIVTHCHLQPDILFLTSAKSCGDVAQCVQ